MINIISGIGDYLSIYLTIRQIPKNALIQNYELSIYSTYRIRLWQLQINFPHNKGAMPLLYLILIR